jgi:hypothetical protein
MAEKKERKSIKFLGVFFLEIKRYEYLFSFISFNKVPLKHFKKILR